MQNNEQFLVTARKWRPLKFSDVVGQEHITKTLINAIINNRVHHAYLFCGPRGVGKTTTARILARAVNFPELLSEQTERDNLEKDLISEGRSLDIIEIDGASNNSVDDVRKLRENAKYPPSIGKYKLYIIDEVHMLSNSAFNALLKILEEPPPHLIFVFATTEIHKVPATIISRTQRFDFRRMEVAEIVERLKFISHEEGIEIDDQSLYTIAKKADGSMRDSQSIFDQVIAFCGNKVRYSEMADSLNLIDEEFYFKISDAIINKDSKAIFELTSEILKRGYDIKEAINGLLEHLRNIITVKVINNSDYIESSQELKEMYLSTAIKFTKKDLIRIINEITKLEEQIKYSVQPSIRLELGLVKIASMDKSVEIENLIKQINQLKKKSNLAVEESELESNETKTEKGNNKEKEITKTNFATKNLSEKREIKNTKENSNNSSIQDSAKLHPTERAIVELFEAKKITSI